ncbi:hypothetical protein SKAU_G00398090 [Synaphobranchus kaupii]|uniref:Uncharacterized protein n=1 Tax=Synaphobranchus kaupii TaxID=118154 RepID=A0A9Q1IBA7_SYNKA|nr:hypothetical protein SKAU_G00398090 [Synaphobranchus kaupii]
MRVSNQPLNLNTPPSTLAKSWHFSLPELLSISTPCCSHHPPHATPETTAAISQRNDRDRLGSSSSERQQGTAPENPASTEEDEEH